MGCFWPLFEVLCKGFWVRFWPDTADTDFSQYCYGWTSIFCQKAMESNKELWYYPIRSMKKNGSSNSIGTIG
jgi:hypothetical protein